MTNLNTFRNVGILRTAALVKLFLLLFLFSNQVYGQCPESLGCNDNVQISLDYDCYAEIHPDLILEDERDNCPYMVTILDLNDQIMAETQVHPGTGDFIYPSIDGAFVGSVWKASVSIIDSYGIKNSCWGYFTVEDKLPPTITCIEDFTVECSEDLSELYSSESTLDYCSDINPADLDYDGLPSTKTICLNTTDTANPWEIVESVLISGPVTGSGTGLLSPATGSGTMTIGHYTYKFGINPVTGQIENSELIGVQAKKNILKNKIFLTVDSSNDLSDGVCVEVKTTSFYNYQSIDNCDPSTEVIITSDDIEDLQCGESGIITARRDIEYITKDNAGLSPQPCDFSIYFEKKSLSELDFPDNIIFDCDEDIIFDDDGNLDLGPHVAGWPLLDGDPLTEDNNLCRINVTFEDDTFSICGVNTLKILRRWTALDWCAGEYTHAYQSIKVHDENAPSFTCPDGYLIFEADGDCTADIIFKPLDQSDTTGVESFRECSSFTVNVEYLDADGKYKNASGIGNNMFAVNNLGYGYHTIRYSFTDECGNSDYCTFEVRVIDDAAPIPVCDQYTAVVLADNGWARAYTQTFDDGSYDDCGGPVTFQVRRPDLHCAPYDSLYNIFGEFIGVQDTMYNDYVEFCCDDAGQTVDVILKVTDAGGRYNTCLVKVQVQDKTPYNIVSCPQKIWNLDCYENLDSTKLGIPVVEDNCSSGNLFLVDSGDFDSACGQGTITRRWYMTVNGSDLELEECRQTINIFNQDRLTHNDFDWPAAVRTDADCSNWDTDLGDTVRYKGVPVNEAQLCGLLAYSYSDKVFQNVEGYCLKIIRTWTVVDWCVYDPNDNAFEGIWSDTQIIKISSTEGPELSHCSQDTILYALDNTCSASISLQAPSAFDNCFNEAVPRALIQYEMTDVLSGAIVTSGNGNFPNTVLDLGHYRITWTATGSCGTESRCSSDILVIDGKAPQPYCKSGITTVLMPAGANGEDPYVEIWASDFDLNSTDNCDPVLQFSFEPDLIVPNKRFTCDELGLQSLNVWVIDDAFNKDFCHTAINIQANNDICPQDTMTGMMIAGHIGTEMSEMVENIEVSLQKMSNAQMNYHYTDEEGEFAFGDMLAHDNYTIRPSLDVDYLNGVSTLDLILIQRHILGIESLDSPYKLIAADVNSNADISAIDLIELRKLILGIYEELPQNSSWRFVDKSQQFTDPHHPWPFKEDISINDLSGDMMNNDFVAVKIGDVNGSLILNQKDNNITSRSDEKIELSYDILELTKNSEFLIPFYLDTEKEVNGIQFGLQFFDEVEILGLESGKMDLSVVNYLITDNGINISWNDMESIHAKKDEALFYLTVASSGYTKVSDFELSGKLRNELYSSDMDVHQLRLTNGSQDTENRLYQNTPNPFSTETQIQFELSKAMNVRVTIMDASGQLVKSYDGHFEKGENAVTVTGSDLNGNGIYYFNLETEAFSATKKMILIE
ncbi:MAG: T9SS type A sorting domain-containing protein [Bacteroidia bacterium]|nr:T9SS type A sorting domain-containing protein [Bacteroidia bacterium]